MSVPPSSSCLQNNTTARPVPEEKKVEPSSDLSQQNAKTGAVAQSLITSGTNQLPNCGMLLKFPLQSVDSKNLSSMVHVSANSQNPDLNGFYILIKNLEDAFGFLSHHLRDRPSALLHLQRIFKIPSFTKAQIKPKVIDKKKVVEQRAEADQKEADAEDRLKCSKKFSKRGYIGDSKKVAALKKKAEELQAHKQKSTDKLQRLEGQWKQKKEAFYRL